MLKVAKISERETRSDWPQFGIEVYLMVCIFELSHAEKVLREH